MTPQVAELPPVGGPAWRRQAWAKLRWPLQWTGVALAVLGILLLWAWQQGYERRAVRALSPQEREVIYTQTLQTLRTMCTDSKPSLRDYCIREAEFVVNFPECDAGCRELARHISPPGRTVP